MRTILSRIVTTAAALTLAAALAPPAQAVAAAATPLKLVFGSLQAIDLEESGEDEIRVEVKEPNGDHYYIWPTNGDEADTKVGTCWVWTSEASACSPGSSSRSAGPYTHLTVYPGASFTIEVWEDDHIGDDLLLRIPVTPTEGTQYIDASSPAGKGFSYRLVARLEPA
ncbi:MULTISPECIES: hypothetical protein [Streptosporangium]|uniref:Secreted protein n=1 Tax=Streptosporangium brasiliense TaxID=47480 RepID=A0ABT9R1N3_9ACTN|nr:hypothetical protein [Streptosporangium brasiliense]MDP9863141.1 hypothetical protein [Streptosporangium brasiliense]